MRAVVVLRLSLALLAVTGRAQDPPPAPSAPAPVTPETPQTHSGAPLGQFTVGPLIVTPTFRIGTLAIDTNVEYQRIKRTDFIAAAGPGLDLALPFLDHWKFDVEAFSQYLYYHKTAELRRWTGGGRAALYWKTTGTRASVSTGLRREFSRPNFEIDTRVAWKEARINGTLERDLGRLTLRLDTFLSSNTVDQGQEYRGADLSTTLSTDRYNIFPELHYRLTPLSALILETEFEATRFPSAAVRNFYEGHAGVGLLTAGLFKGRVTAGLRRTRLNDSGETSLKPYLRGNLAQQLSRRFRLAETFDQESTVSAFAVDGSLPTYDRRVLTVNLTTLITKRIDLQLSATREKLGGAGLFLITIEDGTTVTGKRDAVAYVTTADLGIRLSRARLGVFASYTTRESQSRSDFGIDGLVTGLRLEYAPQ